MLSRLMRSSLGRVLDRVAFVDVCGFWLIWGIISIWGIKIDVDLIAMHHICVFFVEKLSKDTGSWFFWTDRLRSH